MRRSTSVTLTLVPILAAVAVASADPPPQELILEPPGLVGPLLAPPGMVPTILELRCEDDPEWRMRIDCNEVDVDGTVIRGGFGQYFWTAGG